MLKRLFLQLLIICFTHVSVCAKEIANNELPILKYGGKQFSLLYSEKVKDINGYTNEYFKYKESCNNWSELIAVHHFPTDYSPIDKANEFQIYLMSMGCLSNVTTNGENNTAVIDFVVADNSRKPLIMEFNIFKYKKDKICGTVAMQYAKRYIINNALDVEKVRKSFEKERTKNLKKFEALEFPELIPVKIVNGKYILNESIKNANEEIDKIIKENPETETTTPDASTDLQ